MTTTSTTRLEKPLYLWLARGIWILLALTAVVIFIASNRGFYTNFREPCNTLKAEEQAHCFEEEQTLAQFGLSRNFFSIYWPLGQTIEVLPWLITGILIFWKKSDTLFGLLFSLMLMMAVPLNIDSDIRESAVYFYPNLLAITNAGTYIGALLLILGYRFPDGRFVPRWLRWCAIAWIALQSGNYFLPDTAFNFFNWPSPWPEGIQFLFAASIVYSNIYRYRHIADPAQKQQIKWVVFGFTILGVMANINYLNDALINLGIIPWNDNLKIVWWLTYWPLFYLSVMFVGVSLGFSILRYRLWDIDFIINRSLVYGALTVLLALVFGGSLFLVSRIVEGQNFVLAFGITAVIVGSSFNPARRRIQRFVDQRFYNIHIDYQKTPLDIPSGGATQVLRTTHFGVYQNLELIGRGGMAEVYKSTHPQLNQPVAIKILPAQLAEEAEFRQRFTREAQVVSKLTHPNIVRVFDSGEQDGKHYMVMEYLTGQDLDKFIRTHGRLALSQALPLVQQIAAALDYAHSQGFIHRDIKPSNVLLDTSNSHQRAILTDFGIAKILNSKTAMTRTGSVMGTFDYIAPEQIQESSTLDGRADIYALGIMVYQMLTGELPFKHNNPGALLIAHLTQPPPDSCKLLPDLPERVCNAIQKAMAKKPEERFTTASEFVGALSMN